MEKGRQNCKLLLILSIAQLKGRGNYFMVGILVWATGHNVKTPNLPNHKFSNPSSYLCSSGLEINNNHRRRKRGGQGGRLAPPSFKLGGHRPPNFTHCLHNELHCSIVNGIACIGIVLQGNHIFVV